MSCVPKFDAYFNKLENVGDSITVPAKSMKHLSNNVHFYQHSESRNKKGLILTCRKVASKNMIDEFTVIVVATGRWDTP